MEKFFTCIVALLACFGIMPATAQESETPNVKFTVNIPNSETVKCQVQGADYTLTDGPNVFEVPEYTSVNFSPVYPWKFSSITDKTGAKAPGFSGTTSSNWYLYVQSGIQDEEYTIEVANLNDLRTAQFTINVDDPSLVNAMVDGYYEKLVLNPGENIISYQPNVETFLTLTPTDNVTPFYSVKQNGVTVEPQGNSYGIRLTKDCIIDVTAILPDEEHTVKFTYSEGAENAVKIMVNNEQVTELDGNVLPVKIGTTVTLVGNTQEYKINEIKINGVPVSFYGSCSFSVMSDTEVYIDARPYDKISATIIVTDPELITISANGQPLILNAGENTVELPENNSQITWNVSGLGILNSVRVNEGDALQAYQTYYTLQKGDVIEFDLLAKVFDQQAVVWIDNTKGKACYNYLDLSSNFDRSVRYNFENGYNIIEYYQAMNPFSLNWNGYTGEYPDPTQSGKVYLNGELQAPLYEGSTNYELNLANGDVLKLFMDSDPVKCDVSFNIAEGVEASVVKDIITSVENPSAGFDCFAGTLVSVSGDKIKVTVNGKEIIAVENEDAAVPVYTFTVEEATTAVEVAAGDTTAVMSIEADSDSTVYNMQGVKVGSKADLRSLAPGLYIVSGRKVSVTK